MGTLTRLLLQRARRSSILSLCSTPPQFFFHPISNELLKQRARRAWTARPFREPLSLRTPSEKTRGRSMVSRVFTMSQTPTTFRASQTESAEGATHSQCLNLPQSSGLPKLKAPKARHIHNVSNSHNLQGFPNRKCRRARHIHNVSISHNLQGFPN